MVEIALNDKSLYPIFTEDVEEWQVLYPAIDVLQELRKMKGWCDANPKNRKTKSGVKRFVNSWLSRAQDKAPKVRGEVKSCESESSVRLW